jgi:MFS family permease
MLLRGGIGLPIGVAFLYGAQLFGAQAPISVYLRSDPATLGFGFGAAASAAGTMLSIMALAAFLGASLADRVSRAIGGPRSVALGGGLSAIAYAGMILAPGTLVTFTVWLAVAGLGSGLVSGTLPTLVVQRAAADSVGIASGLYNTARTAAGGVAGALFALLMAALTTPTAAGARAATELSFHAVWWICAGLSVLFAVAVLFIRPAKPATPQAPATPVSATSPDALEPIN